MKETGAGEGDWFGVYDNVLQRREKTLNKESGDKHREISTGTRDVKKVVRGLGDQADRENEIIRYLQ